MSTDNGQVMEFQDEDHIGIEDIGGQPQETDVSPLKEKTEESIRECLKKIKPSPSPLTLSPSSEFVMNSFDKITSKEYLEVFWNRCAGKMKVNICVIWIVQGRGVYEKTHHPARLQGDQQSLPGETGFVTINQGRKQWGWLYEGDLEGFYKQIFNSENEQEISAKLTLFCEKKTEEEINASTLRETADNNTQPKVSETTNNDIPSIETDLPVLGAASTAESPPTIQASNAFSFNEGKNNAFDTYLILHNISRCNEGGPTMIESSRHVSIVVDSAGGHTKQDLHGYQIQLVKEKDRPRYLVQLGKKITKSRAYYNKVYHIGNCREIMEQRVRTTSNEADLAVKSEECLEQLAKEIFEELKTQNQILGKSADNLWTDTLNCQTYAKELVEQLGCKWPEEVNVFAENCILANAIFHVKREVENTCST